VQENRVKNEGSSSSTRVAPPSTQVVQDHGHHHGDDHDHDSRQGENQDVAQDNSPQANDDDRQS
jgi:hypothetical protein